jgi:hypothetical protein
VRLIKGFAGFWYDFVIGDDWKIAAAVVVTLGVGAIGVATSAIGLSVLPPLIAVLVLVAYTISLVIDVRE